MILLLWGPHHHVPYLPCSQWKSSEMNRIQLNTQSVVNEGCMPLPCVAYHLCDKKKMNLCRSSCRKGTLKPLRSLHSRSTMWPTDWVQRCFSLSAGFDDISDCIDLIICLGGDGTLLYASSLFQVITGWYIHRCSSAACINAYATHQNPNTFINPEGNFVCDGAPFNLKTVHGANGNRSMQKIKIKDRKRLRTRL